MKFMEGLDGLDSLERETPDIVICDIKMEKFNGFHF
jgi:YesN/AraC family two-component response regulator